MTDETYRLTPEAIDGKLDPNILEPQARAIYEWMLRFPPGSGFSVEDIELAILTGEIPVIE